MSDQSTESLAYQVNQLVTTYNFAWDEGRFDDVASCFISDGVFVDATNTRHEGRPAIEEFGRKSLTIFGAMRHLTTNHAISRDGSTWIHRCYILFTWGLGTPNKTSATGKYDDTFVLTDQGPLFAVRHVLLDA